MHELHLERQGRRILLFSRIPLTGLRTAIPGAYQRVDGTWTVPLNYESCLLLQQRYRDNGWRMTVGSELERWAESVKQTRRAAEKLSKATDAVLHVLPRVAPKLAKAMRRRTYQRVGVRFIADTGSSLNADEPGLGKTLIAMGGILEAEIAGPYLVVAPKTATKSVWRDEIRRWLPEHHRVITVPESRAKRDRVLNKMKLTPTTWVVVHPEMVLVRVLLKCRKCGKLTEQKKRVVDALSCGPKNARHHKDRRTERQYAYAFSQLFAQRWGAIVSDEAHETLVIRSGWPTQRRRGMDMLPLRRDGIRIALTGTPFDGRPHQLFGTLNWLAPTQYSSRSRWTELYWTKGGYTGWQLGEFRKEREKMLWDSLGPIALRRTKAEVAQDLPPKMAMGTKLNPEEPQSPVGIWLEMTGKQSRAYGSMLSDSTAQLKSGRLEPLTALEELTRLKQLAASYGDIQMTPNDEGGYNTRFIPQLPSNKFNWTVENLEEWGFPHHPITKVVIVSFYTSLLELFRAELERYFKTKPKKPMCAMISGKNARSRPEVIRRFNGAGDETVLLLNIKAGGTAITIDSADRMITLSQLRNPDPHTQVENRIHRVSNPRQCMYYNLNSIGTVDVGTTIANAELARDGSRLLDTRRGVEYLRYIIELSK